MFTRNSPLKRKHNEFHDPDYPQEEEGNDQPGCSTKDRSKRSKSGDAFQEGTQENYLHKVSHLIEREFQREIELKQKQLEEIDERLKKAKHILERLRYGIVSAYYKKQEIPLNASDAVALRGTNCLFEREEKGPQMPIHPSVKKLIGKKPRDLSDFMRACPQRMAAQNAVQTIRAKTQAQKRDDKKLKQIIRDYGIVIDHSKQNTTGSDVNALLNAAIQGNKKNPKDLTTTINTASVKKEPINEEYSNKPSGKSLNAARLNNKIKHLIVVGNTSKYIGSELEKDVKSNTKHLTHKWLVYVQSKEANMPIERFIKKVRFHLHRSYRPNDVLDIESPPFQVTRRGWGEFPIRVQLFFHPELHQKPIQLIHNIILDQTLSGIQTLGAETLLEIWLRDVKCRNSITPVVKEEKVENDIVKKPETPTKQKTPLIAHSEELVDENLLDFLNKIEASPCSISADIEKIQPTVVVNEPLGVKIKNLSPEKLRIFKQTSPVKIPPQSEAQRISELNLASTSNLTNNSTAFSTSTTTSVSASEQLETTICSSTTINANPVTSFIKLPSSSAQIKLTDNSTATATANNISQIPPLKPIMRTTATVLSSNQDLSSTVQKPSIIVNKDGKILMPSASVASAVRRTVLPIVGKITTAISTANKQSTATSTVSQPKIISILASSAATVFNAPKQVLQKKFVQLVDSTGKVKYIQMLVATCLASSSGQNANALTAAPKLVTLASNSVTNTTQATKTVTTPLLKSPNGVQLMPAMTTKPNIFKFVPESMQTKPQILTFSTTSVGIRTINTLTTANTQQNLQHSITTSAQSAVPITTPSSITMPKTPNIVKIPIANKLQKSSDSNTVAAAKNFVFQKEGKLYIIDPQQMKYKQQQKKQVSLLKPQISLLKQQQPKPITPPAAATGNSLVDTNKIITTKLLPNNNANIPQLYFGSKQQRINSINVLQFMQMKRVLFEKQFLRQEFTSMREAVEFLLRRLKLIVPKDSLVSDFAFVSHTLQEFHALTAFKQRACEWLRAKNITQLLRSHKQLQSLNNTSKEIFWSTKEVAIFARQYAYTPPIKSMPRPGDQQQGLHNNSKGFMALVKSELEHEHHVHYDTLTDHYKVRKWVDKVWHTLESYEHNEDQHQIIDIDGTPEDDCTNNRIQRTIANKTTSHLAKFSLDTYVAAPAHLENQCQLVSDICKDLNIKLLHEEIDTNVYHPSMQTVLAQCLHLFIEKVLRQSIAIKKGKALMSAPTIESICTLMPQDFVKALATSSEFDFLTNNNFGSASLAEGLEFSIKQEKS